MKTKPPKLIALADAGVEHLQQMAKYHGFDEMANQWGPAFTYGDDVRPRTIERARTELAKYLTHIDVTNPDWYSPVNQNCLITAALVFIKDITDVELGARDLLHSMEDSVSFQMQRAGIDQHHKMRKFIDKKLRARRLGLRHEFYNSKRSVRYTWLFDTNKLVTLEVLWAGETTLTLTQI